VFSPLVADWWQNTACHDKLFSENSISLTVYTIISATRYKNSLTIPPSENGNNILVMISSSAHLTLKNDSNR